jgi:hypothetical protein
MTVLYLDSCALQRPFDALRAPHERAEAACVELLINAVEQRTLELGWSSVLTFECIESAPLPRAVWARRIRGLATRPASLTEGVLRRAHEFERDMRIQSLDALHLACAESLDALLVTVDRRRFLNRVTRSSLVRIRAMDPVAAAAHLGL